MSTLFDAVGWTLHGITTDTGRAFALITSVLAWLIWEHVHIRRQGK